MQNASRIELYPISQQVHIDGELSANSKQALAYRVLAYQPRHYIYCEDVWVDLVTVSETTTFLPLHIATL
ncbi:hypothetical protein [Vreelandella profundi]|uniref:hypothetical protein n=1 Tax=Vreelandella profundi TaxID=2852117 RepID=UPI001EF02803|nr:hypothetical protein [Halomonas profundi]